MALPDPIRGDQIPLLAELRDAGLPNAVIADRLGISRYRLYYLVKIADLPRRNLIRRFWVESKLECLASLMRDHTFAQIARIMGTTKNAAVGAANRHLGGKKPVPALPRPTIEIPPLGVCRWVEGDIKRGTATYSCGERVLPGESYCRAHRVRVYRPAESRSPAL